MDWMTNHFYSLARTQRDTVREVILSPSFKYMATFGIGCDVMIWDAKFGRLLLNLVGHQRNIRSVDFATETEAVLLLVSGDEEGKTILWNLTAEHNNIAPPSPPASTSNPPPPDDDEYLPSFQHPPEDLLISWHHHRVPIRSVRFCGGPTKVVSCDAVGKVIVVDALSTEVLVEFTGGEVSCSPWNFWWRGTARQTATTGLLETTDSLPHKDLSAVTDIFLVTTSLTKMVIWDCESGKTASHRDIPEDAGFIECYDVSTDTVDSQLLSVACCTDSGKAFCWTPDKIEVAPEDEDFDDDDDKEVSTESSIHTLVDLFSTLPQHVKGPKNGFRGIR